MNAKYNFMASKCSLFTSHWQVYQKVNFKPLLRHHKLTLATAPERNLSVAIFHDA